MNPLYALLLTALVLSVFALAAPLRDRLGIDHELSRKFVHFTCTAGGGFLPLFVDRATLLVAATALVPLIVYASWRGWLGAIVREGRSVLGPVWTLVAFGLLLAFEENAYRIAIAMVVSGAGDAVACLVGRGWGRRRIAGSDRTWLGTSSLAVVAALATLALAPFAGYRPDVAIVVALSVALVCAAVETLSPHALDNLLVPLAAAAVLDFTAEWSGLRALGHLFELAAAVAVCVFGVRAVWLTERGAIAVFLVGVLTFVSAGWPLVAVLLLFFAASSVLSRQRPDRWVQADAKTGRDISQALAFGLAPMAFALAYGMTEVRVLLGCAVASVSAACADTFATEIGRRSSAVPVQITTWQRVEAGASGGVTLLGVGGTLLGAALIAVSGLLLGLLSFPQVLLVTAIGVAASLLDSVLGAHVQEIFRCSGCGRLGETANACTCGRGERVRGLPGMSNEMVNFCISAAAALTFLGAVS